MTMTLEQALVSLDPTNAEQWTADGFPKMDVLQGLVGDPSLKRSAVNKVAPNFSRENPTLEVAPEAPAPSGQTAQGATGEPTLQEPEPPVDEPEPPVEEPVEEAADEDNDLPEEDEVDSAIAAISQDIAEREEALNKDRAELDEMIRQKDRLIEAREVKRTPMSDTEERLRFIKRQAALRAERAGAMQEAKALLKGMAAVGAVPIDLALAGRPRQRPQG